MTEAVPARKLRHGFAEQGCAKRARCTFTLNPEVGWSLQVTDNEADLRLTSALKPTEL